MATAGRAGVEVTVETTGTACELPSALDIAAYRILQESITNVIRHAGPSRARISPHYGTKELLITVAADDGGATPSDQTVDRLTPARRSLNGGGRGIVGMRERCELLGGRLTAGPAPGGGFVVQVALPLRPELVPAT